MKTLFLAIFLALIAIGLVWYAYTAPQGKVTVVGNTSVTSTPTIAPASPTPSIQLVSPPMSKTIPLRAHVFQSFNNCGPASLSMLLSYGDITVSQEELGKRLRPYQNPAGDNDDKSVTLEELAEEAKTYGFISYHRPNGSMKLIRMMIAYDIPIVVRTWLHPNEDIGHYRLVRGYNDSTQEIVQDDSYENKNLRYSYSVFNDMWQPFNYEFLVIVKPEQQQLAEAILQGNVSEEKAWQNVLARAQEDTQINSNNPYPLFNQSVAQYHLGNNQEAVLIYESVQNRLPPRMLWYQIEPIQAYLEVGNYEKVFELTDRILNNNNRGFTELYLIRGEAYKRQGNMELARAEFEKAVFYNQNSSAARTALQSIQ